MAENKSLDQMTDAPASDPYLLQTIKPKSAWFTDYHSLATGSLSQYIAITSGQYAACQRKGPCGKFDVPSIFSQLGDGGWKAWMESDAVTVLSQHRREDRKPELLQERA